MDALECFLAENGLPDDTKFWVCDFVIQQNNVKLDLPHLGACVEATDRTVLMMVPWHAPEPMNRAYCIKEMVFTQLAKVCVCGRGGAPPPSQREHAVHCEVLTMHHLTHLLEPPLRGDGRGGAREVPRRAAG